MSNGSRKLPALVSKIEPDVRRYLERVREIIGNLDNDIDARATRILRVYTGRGGGGGTDPDPVKPGLPGEPTPPGPAPADPPTVPKNLEVRAYFVVMVIDWDQAPFSGFKHTEIWGAEWPTDADKPTVEQAKLIATTEASSYHHTVEESARWCYWVRYVNTADEVGPWNATEGTCGSTALLEDPTKPTNFYTEAGPGVVRLFWDRPTYMGHDVTEIRRAETDVGDPDQAEFLDYAPGGYFYTDSVPAGQGYYYWIRHINRRKTAGEWFSDNGVYGESQAYDQPTRPTGVEVKLIADMAIITWDVAEFFGHKHTRVYHANSIALPGGAPAVATTTATSAAIPVDLTKTNCFWVRHVNLDGVVGDPQLGAPTCAVPDVEQPTQPEWEDDPVGGAFETILLNWKAATYKGHAYTEIWASTTNQRAQAQRVGTSITSTFSYQPGDAQTRWFWLRHVNQLGQSGPFTTTPVNYALSVLPDVYLDALDAGIRNTDFFNEVDQLEHIETDAQGRISGYGIGFTGGRSDFAVRADRFYIAPPDGAGQGVIPFTVVPRGYTDADGFWIPAGTYIRDARIRNASITDAKIRDLNADKIKAGSMLADHIKGGTISGDVIKVATRIESHDYSAPNQQGFRIDGNGRCVFNDVLVRGEVYATSGRFEGAVVTNDIQATGILRTQSATSQGSGRGVFARDDWSGFYFRAGYGSSDRNKARLEVSNGDVRIFDNDGYPLLAAGPNTQNKVWVREIEASAIRTGVLRSTEYIEGRDAANNVSWRINGNGNAFFNNGFFRGTLDGADGNFTGTVSAGKVTGDSEIAVGGATSFRSGVGVWMGRTGDQHYKVHIGDPSRRHFMFNGNGVYLMEGNTQRFGVDQNGARIAGPIVVYQGDIRSSHFVEDSAGWIIRANGNAEFNNVKVRVKRSDISTDTRTGERRPNYTYSGTRSYTTPHPLMANDVAAGTYLITIWASAYVEVSAGDGQTTSTHVWVGARAYAPGEYSQKSESIVCGTRFGGPIATNSGDVSVPIRNSDGSISGMTAVFPANEINLVQRGQVGAEGMFSHSFILKDVPEGANLRGYIDFTTRVSGLAGGLDITTTIVNYGGTIHQI